MLDLRRVFMLFWGFVLSLFVFDVLTFVFVFVFFMSFLLFEIWKHRISVFDAKVLEMLQRCGIIELGIRHPLNMVEQQNLEFEDLKIQMEKVEVFQGQSYWWQGEEAKDDCDDFRSFPLSSSQTNYDKVK